MMIGLLNRCALHSNCSMSIQIEEPFNGPVYISLELTRFFQSHKRMIGSIPKSQLHDLHTKMQTLSVICQDAFTYKNFDVDKNKFKDSDIANPCGLMSRFFPQDKFLRLVQLDNNGKIISKDI